MILAYRKAEFKMKCLFPFDPVAKFPPRPPFGPFCVELMLKNNPSWLLLGALAMPWVPSGSFGVPLGALDAALNSPWGLPSRGLGDLWAPLGFLGRPWDALACPRGCFGSPLGRFCVPVGLSLGTLAPPMGTWATLAPLLRLLGRLLASTLGRP